ncbi:MAG: hypothetical protein IPN42_04245 [Methylococcaceae bacterium]|nr:hypothetical protein [Methylococcaceae bacterium]
MEDLGIIMKVLFFLLWPLLLLLIFYIFNKKKFLEKLEKYKQGGFFEKK